MSNGKLCGDVDFDEVEKGRIGNNARSGRRRPDDDCDAYAQHDNGGKACTRKQSEIRSKV